MLRLFYMGLLVLRWHIQLDEIYCCLRQFGIVGLCCCCAAVPPKAHDVLDAGMPGTLGLSKCYFSHL